MIRTFVAIPLKNNAIISRQQTLLQKLLPGSRIKWVEPHNFHLTLKFIGDTEESSVNTINNTLEEIASGYPPFVLEYDRTGYFGSQHQPRVIWFGFRAHPLLSEIQQEIETVLVQYGIRPDDKEYKPHLTIGRVKKIAEREAFSDFFRNQDMNIGEKLAVDAFQLIRSTLHSSGPVYTIIKEFKLKKV
jgi:2'-5' RNA ligase